MTGWWVAIGWSLGWALLWRLPRLRTPDRAEPRPDLQVSVVIPARNESDRLPALLGSLARQDRAPDQVVVVDDSSSDETAAVAASFAEVEVINAPPVPDGWAGKPWACTTGARSARGDVLVFLDADVDLDASAIASLLATWAPEGGLLSVQPHHHIRRPVEAISLPFNVVSMMGLGAGSVIPPAQQWGAAGPCMVTSRRDYDLVGGHGSVADEVAEDLALAERYRAAGLSVRCLAGGGMVRYRMYRDGRALVEGWSKNLATGAGRTPVLRSLAIAIWMTAMLTMALRLVDVPTSTATSWPWALVYAAGALQIGLLGRQVGRFGAAFALWPLLLAGFVAVFVRSVFRTLLVRQVRWSGRDLAIVRRR